MVRKIKAKLVLQLRNQGLSGRAIASAQGIARNSVQAVLDTADRLGLGWDHIEEMPEAEVYAALFPGRGVHESVFAQPDWVRVHTELARVGVTLKLLHQEYVDTSGRAGQATMSYDRFCRLYGDYAAVSGATSRVGHKAGRSIEVDWSGPTMQLLDPSTGEISKVYLFVACLPFSRYAFVEASLDMRQESWLRAHASMFAFFGGTVPRLVPDNLKTGVISHPREGEIVLNDAYREMAAHYSAAVLPGRVRAPKDKASVENTVSHVATWVIAGLRAEQFTSLAQLRSDVPVGALLSGGFDSGMIVASAAGKCPELHTYSVGFDDGGLGDTVLRHDTVGGTTAVRRLGAGLEAGEMVFVPSSPDAAEDDGRFRRSSFEVGRRRKRGVGPAVLVPGAPADPRAGRRRGRQGSHALDDRFLRNSTAVDLAAQRAEAAHVAVRVREAGDEDGAREIHDLRGGRGGIIPAQGGRQDLLHQAGA